MSEQPPADPYQPHEPPGFQPPVPPVPPAQPFPPYGAPAGESPTYSMPAAGQPYPPTVPLAAGGQQTAQFPASGQPAMPGQVPAPMPGPVSGQPGYPTSGVPHQGAFPPPTGYPQQVGYPQQPGFPPQPGYPVSPAPAPKKRRALLITSIILGVVVLLCAGGGVTGFLLTRNLDGKGQASPTEAVTGFLHAVYDEHDADKAGSYVCGAAKDTKAITRKINEAEQAERKYPSAQFRWSTPTVREQKTDSAVVMTKLRLLTTDERMAEQDLKFTVIKKNGWLVCEIQQQKS